jgi:hypothetical protein
MWRKPTLTASGCEHVYQEGNDENHQTNDKETCYFHRGSLLQKEPVCGSLWHGDFVTLPLIHLQVPVQTQNTSSVENVRNSISEIRRL